MSKEQLGAEGGKTACVCQSEELGNDTREAADPGKESNLVLSGSGMHLVIPPSILTVLNINVAFSRLIFNPLKITATQRLLFNFQFHWAFLKNCY